MEDSNPSLGTTRVHGVHRELNDEEKAEIESFKEQVAALIDRAEKAKFMAPKSEAKRVFAVAQTDLESAVHWFTKGITK